MNILFLSDIYSDAAHPSRGAFNFELCAALAENHDVRVIAPRGWPEVLRSLMSGQSYRPRPHPEGPNVPVAFPTYWYTPKILREHYGDFLWRSIRNEVRHLSRSFAPDAVLSYWAHPDGEVGLRAARMLGVPAAVIVGGSDVLLLPHCPKRGARVRNVLRASDAVITISEGLREKVIELGVDGDHVHTIRQGINPRLFFTENRLTENQQAARARLVSNHPALDGERAMLLWVGRMVDVKRLDVLVTAAAELRRRRREFVLCLAGDGPLREQIAEMVSEQGLENDVLFTGALPPEALGDWYRAANATVMSSDSEGLPNVLRESLACGTPFVATDVGSIREIADERYAILVPSGDAKSLADGLETVLDGTHQENARCYDPRTWEMMAEEVTALLDQCGAENLSTKRSEELVCHV